MAFLEERLPVDIKMGATYADDYAVDITRTKSGAEHRRLIHPYPQRSYNVAYLARTPALWAAILALYHRAYGMYAGFRVRAMDDFSTNADVGTPTAVDEPALLVSAGVYQLQKQYGAGATPLSIGLPVRTLFKPVAGTAKVAVSAVEVASGGWSIDNTTGLVTFSANKTGVITAITKAASAVISIAGHSFLVGESVHVSGVVGMTQINGLRALITAISAGVSITVAIDSTGFSNYTSGGVANTRPQSGEAVTAGCQFDIPFRFNSRVDVVHTAYDVRETLDIEIVELLNP